MCQKSAAGPKIDLSFLEVTMNIRLLSGTSCPRSIRENDIRTCIAARREKEVLSLCGKLADCFRWSNKEAAKVAIFRLAHASTAAQQLSFFSELKQYVAHGWQNSLTWQIRSDNPPIFRIGEVGIECCAPPENAAADHFVFDLEDTCRLLCSMHYDGDNVVSEFHRFAVKTMSGRTADAVLAAQERFLDEAPNLLSAMKLIGLPQDHSYREIGPTVERIIYEATGNVDAAARAGHNAVNLTFLASMGDSKTP
ncbi:hypothetical protein RO07_20835 [Pandoraea pulmonicola]|uniref:Uncharacterized protein n=2 Tax=Pandoraea pulmonicola TaxID=93221 RepID=A0ABM5S3H0_PANPU|nr:hypothetical protein RO07_20835 [Pandoraea pulmonicola]